MKASNLVVMEGNTAGTRKAERCNVIGQPQAKGTCVCIKVAHILR